MSFPSVGANPNQIIEEVAEDPIDGADPSGAPELVHLTTETPAHGDCENAHIAVTIIRGSLFVFQVSVGDTKPPNITIPTFRSDSSLSLRNDTLKEDYVIFFIFPLKQIIVLI